MQVRRETKPKRKKGQREREHGRKIDGERMSARMREGERETEVKLSFIAGTQDKNISKNSANIA